MLSGSELYNRQSSVLDKNGNLVLQTKAVIINADDFGLSPGVNRGILSGFRNGILTSTTLLANLPSFDDAVSLARENPDLPVGVHLSLLWGRPVTDPSRIPTLVDRGGRFLTSARQLAARCILSRVSVQDITTEFRNQIRKVLDAGLHPTHLDTHKHIHCLPRIMRALISVAGRFGIDKVRLPSERSTSLRNGPHRRRCWRALAKRVVVRSLCRNVRADLRAAGIKTTDHFVGIAHSASLDTQALLDILRHLEQGVTEVMCHPGYIDGEMRRYTGSPPHREVELDALTDRQVRDYVNCGPVRLTHFGDL